VESDDRQPALKATGERLVPERQYGQLVHAEHLVRYRLALQLADSRRVLDAACGSGYGTALLSRAASSAIGVDIDEATIAYARSKHQACEFAVGDVADLPFEADAFDLVVCFETIEHVVDPDQVLQELRRVLSEDGLLVISTPNKHQYLVENEFHRREFSHEEFVELLSARFAHVEVMLQHNWLTSAVLPLTLAVDGSGDRDHKLEFSKLSGVKPRGELYTVALCSSAPMSSLRAAAVGASVDEAHQLARRTVEAERTAEMWHMEYKRAEIVCREAQRALDDVYQSVWWRATAPPRRLLQMIRERRLG